MKLLRLAFALAALVTATHARSLDHTHAAWNTLLTQHVQVAPDGKSSRVDYAAFSKDRPHLQRYLSTLSAVSAREYANWSKPQQFAFLVNAYNAYTVEKVLTRYPDLKSIRDFGRVLGNPWKDRFFTLLEQPQSLDGIEHGLLRAPGVFDEPRVHVAVNCASVGCPMLAPRAFTAATLDAQLEALMRAFLSDRTRNRYHAQTHTLELSRIFDWYRTDFEKSGVSFLGYARFSRVQDLATRYADVLADTPENQAALRARPATVKHLDYDWALNARR